jgi:hypothetical protein
MSLLLPSSFFELSNQPGGLIGRINVNYKAAIIQNLQNINRAMFRID